ncbi:uncharacterized protein LOC113312811 [Papaver somniferum]|uniref:uncharacterized protein LOC113312811 n=1 Tax=Papaver somniferum TaxID=3469 RepID=UPI000E7014AD|nr:uncharacterized protein LOC113312811 [Papaver somniferum]
MFQMGTKIISWNIRGLNAYEKQVAVKDLIAAHRCLAWSIQETKMVSFSNFFVRQLWFDNDFGMEFLPYQGTAGNSGGLVTIWDNANLELLEKRMGFNSISCLFRFRSNDFKFILTNAYSPCDYNLREVFLNDLAEIRLWSSEAWCFTGDANSVRSDAERNKPGGDTRNMDFLNNFIFDHELMDLPLNGGSYTWSNKHDDPLFCSVRRNSSFKIENIWLEHTDFVKLVETWWNSLEFIGAPGREEEDLTEKIKILNMAEETSALTPVQVEERSDFLKYLNNVKVTRAMMAYQRAKSKGFRDGDKNTQYFHKIANGKRRRNYITKLEVDGVDIFNQDVIKMEIHQYYTDLFTAGSTVSLTIIGV